MVSKVRLLNITTKIGSGSTPKGGKAAYLESGEYKLIRSQNIYNHYFSKEGLAYISEEQADKLKIVTLMEDDILINITGDSVARVAMVTNEMLPGRVNQHVSIIRCNKEILNPYYLLAVLTSNEMQRHLLSLAQAGGTRAALTKSMLENLEIDLLGLSNQNFIADLLKNINLKIENNNNVINNLEQISSNIFKNWFIDHEFPNEQGLPYRTSGGKMVESELGLIPEKWSVESLYEFADVIYGAAFSSKFFNENKQGLPLIRIRDLKKGEPNIYTEEQHKKATIIHPGDLLIGMDAEFTPTLWKGDTAYLNQRVCKIQSNKTHIHPLFLFYGLKPYMSFLENSKVGTTVIHLSKSDMDKSRLIMPNKETFELFFEVVDGFYNQIINLNNEIKKLKELRDLLLPKLLSGEIEIPDGSVVD